MSVWTRPDGYFASDEADRIDRATVHRWLSQDAYWSLGIPYATFARSLDGAMCFGVYAPGGTQVAFARAITDRATFGYLGDVYVEPVHRGRGLSKFLAGTIFAHPELQGFRRWSLVTSDAHGLYARFGFAPVAEPGRHMEKRDPDIYTRGR